MTMMIEAVMGELFQRLPMFADLTQVERTSVARTAVFEEQE